MAITSLHGPMFIPPYFLAAQSGGSGALIDAANEYYAVSFFAEKTGSITALDCYFGVVTTAKTIRLGIQSVDATNGAPSGTWLGATANGYGTGTPVNTAVLSVTLNESVSVTAGSSYALVAKWDNDADPGDVRAGGVYVHGIAPFCTATSAATWATSTATVCTPSTTRSTSFLPVFGINYGGTYYPHTAVLPSAIGIGQNLHATNGPSEVGNRFTLSHDTRVVGIWGYYTHGLDATLALKNDSGTDLATVSIDKDVPAGVSSGFAAYKRFFSTAYTLSANTWYRVTIRIATSSVSAAVYKHTYTPSGSIGQMDALGSNYYYCERLGSGSYTNTTGARATIGLIIDGLDFGGGGTVIVVED